MSIDLDLLRKAWPEGFLAMQGVSTVGGWIFVNICWANLGDGQSFTSRHDQAAVSAGDLLPNVDPADTATWACLLRDLADAAGSSSLNLVWMRKDRAHYPEGHRVMWILKNEREDGCIRCFYIDTDDPAEALVLARIQLRKAGAPKPPEPEPKTPGKKRFSLLPPCEACGGTGKKRR